MLISLLGNVTAQDLQVAQAADWLMASLPKVRHILVIGGARWHAN